jgi:hypothetical protein
MVIGQLIAGGASPKASFLGAGTLAAGASLPAAAAGAVEVPLAIAATRTVTFARVTCVLSMSASEANPSTEGGARSARTVFFKPI